MDRFATLKDNTQPILFSKDTRSRNTTRLFS